VDAQRLLCRRKSLEGNYESTRQSVRVDRADAEDNVVFDPDSQCLRDS